MVVLDREACLRRLGEHGVGRVAVTVGALPAIFPVNYVVADGDIVFRTTAGTKLAAATRNSVVAFEVDGFDGFSHTGWSVMIVGPSREVTDPDELARAEHLPLKRWARGGGPESMVRLQGRLISGRELTQVAPEPEDGSGGD